MAEGGDGSGLFQPFRDGGSQHNSPASSVTSLNSLATLAELTHDLRAINLETSDSTIRPDQRISTGPVIPLSEQQQHLGVSNRLQPPPAYCGPTHQVTLQDFGPVSVAHPSFVTSIRASRRRGSLPLPARTRALEGSHSRLSGSAGISASEGSLATHQDFGSAASAEQAAVQPIPTLRQESNFSGPIVRNVTEPELPRVTTSSESAQNLEDVSKLEESPAQVPTAPSPGDAQVRNALAPDAPAPPNILSESQSEIAVTEEVFSKDSRLRVQIQTSNLSVGSVNPVEADSVQDTMQPVSQDSGASAAAVGKALAVTSAVQQLTIKSDRSQAKRSPSPQDALAASVGAAQRQEVPVLQTTVVDSPSETLQSATTTEDPTDGEIGRQHTLMRQMSGSDGASAVSLRRSNSRAEPGDQAVAVPEDASSHDSDSEREKEIDRR